MIYGHQTGTEGMEILFLQRVVVAAGISSLYRTHLTNCPRLVENRFNQCCLAGTTCPNQGDISDCRNVVSGHVVNSYLFYEIIIEDFNQTCASGVIEESNQ